MNTRTNILVGLSVAVLTLTSVIAAPAYAAGGIQTRSAQRLVLIGKDAKLGINDNGAPGSSAGDVRTLALTLTTTSGTVVGTVDIVQTLTDEGAVDRAVKTLVISLPKGTISGMGVATFADFSNPASRPNDKTEQLAIVGGTGKYRGASGFIDIEVLPDFGSRWRISLDG
ncbi:MAG: hypothetical protein F2793_07600 [Actinobacteria bacterium]|uniref:Unannotated protein n=1 Tax=freshwater metagenome TaxID=449393 RepID=A0A6J7EV36_9ZZZZ|nr:hypothetical protein [Actinomycetota bacterium]